MLIDRLNQERHKLSSLGSLLFVAGAVFFAQNIKAPAENIAQEAMELTLTLLEPLLTPPPQPPQPVAPPFAQKLLSHSLKSPLSRPSKRHQSPLGKPSQLTHRAIFKRPLSRHKQQRPN